LKVIHNVGVFVGCSYGNNLMPEALGSYFRLYEMHEWPSVHWCNLASYL